MTAQLIPAHLLWIRIHSESALRLPQRSDERREALDHISGQTLNAVVCVCVCVMKHTSQNSYHHSPSRRQFWSMKYIHAALQPPHPSPGLFPHFKPKLCIPSPLPSPSQPTETTVLLPPHTHILGWYPWHMEVPRG